MTTAIVVENDRLHAGFVTIAEWNTQVLAQMRYLQEVFAGTNTDKIQAAALLTDNHVTNYLVNPLFSLWQRGTGAVTLTATAQICSDQWRAGLSSATGGASGTGSRVTTGLEAGHPIAVSLAYAPGTSGGYVYFYQTIETAPEMYGLAVTAYARVKSSGGGFLRVYNGAFTADTVIPADSSFHDVIVHTTVPNNVTGLFVMFYCYAATTMIIEGVGFSIRNATVRPVPLHPAEDLARCQRYYQKMRINERTTAAGNYSLTSMYRLKEAMFTTPTATYVTGASTNASATFQVPTGMTMGVHTLIPAVAGDSYEIDSIATLESVL